MSNYIPLFYVDVITYPYCHFNAGLPNLLKQTTDMLPIGKVHGANMGPIWGRQDPGGPHVGPVNFAIWAILLFATHLFMGDANHTGKLLHTE